MTTRKIYIESSQRLRWLPACRGLNRKGQLRCSGSIYVFISTVYITRERSSSVSEKKKGKKPVLDISFCLYLYLPVCILPIHLDHRRLHSIRNVITLRPRRSEDCAVLKIRGRGIWKRAIMLFYDCSIRPLHEPARCQWQTSIWTNCCSQKMLYLGSWLSETNWRGIHFLIYPRLRRVMMDDFWVIFFFGFDWKIIYNTIHRYT